MEEVYHILLEVKVEERKKHRKNNVMVNKSLINQKNYKGRKGLMLDTSRKFLQAANYQDTQRRKSGFFV